MISDELVEHALEVLMDKKHEAAKARAAAEDLDRRTKTVLAQLKMKSLENSDAARETWARCQPAFLEHLDQLKEVSELDYIQRDRRSAASAIIDAWRTEQSNARTMGGIR